jgi:enoyl-CoA hydratase
MRAFETLLLEEAQAGVWLLTLNRPDSRNAFNTAMGRELRELFVPLRFTPGDLRCIVVTGAGSAFCAGADLKERRAMSDDDWRAQHAIFREAFHAITECAVPIIGAVNGAAFGGGCELALTCDFSYASTEARFALTEVTLGLMPGVGGTQQMPRAVGPRRAKEIIFTGAPFTAQQATPRQRWCRRPSRPPRASPPTRPSPCARRKRRSTRACRWTSPARSPSRARPTSG